MAILWRRFAPRRLSDIAPQPAGVPGCSALAPWCRTHPSMCAASVSHALAATPLTTASAPTSSWNSATSASPASTPPICQNASSRCVWAAHPPPVGVQPLRSTAKTSVLSAPTVSGRVSRFSTSSIFSRSGVSFSKEGVAVAGEVGRGSGRE